MDGNTIIVYLACIIFLFLIGKFFILPLKSIAKIIGNSILGGILIFIVNSIGVLFEFHIGLNIGTALITGILGIPRGYFTYSFKNFYRLILKSKEKEYIIYKNVKEDLLMKYRQVKQKSRIYEYGPGKEFETKQEAIKKIEKLERSLKTDLALKQIYKISEVKCIDVENALQLVLTIKIPVLLEQKE